MAVGDVHTVYEDGVWKNRVEGGARASNTSPRRIDAVVAGRQAAKKRRVGHVIHSADGGIESERDYRPRKARLPEFAVDQTGEGVHQSSRATEPSPKAEPAQPPIARADTVARRD
jgi:Uncharacterized protein conserved in bacteria (DUF2188)